MVYHDIKIDTKRNMFCLHRVTETHYAREDSQDKNQQVLTRFGPTLTCEEELAC